MTRGPGQLATEPPAQRHLLEEAAEPGAFRGKFWHQKYPGDIDKYDMVDMFVYNSIYTCVYIYVYIYIFVNIYI